MTAAELRERLHGILGAYAVPDDERGEILDRWVAYFNAKRRRIADGVPVSDVLDEITRERPPRPPEPVADDLPPGVVAINTKPMPPAERADAAFWYMLPGWLREVKPPAEISPSDAEYLKTWARNLGYLDANGWAVAAWQFGEFVNMARAVMQIPGNNKTQRDRNVCHALEIEYKTTFKNHKGHPGDAVGEYYDERQRIIKLRPQ